MDFQSLLKLGFTAVEKGDDQEAVNIFRFAIQKALNKEDISNAYYGLGIAMYNLGDLVTAKWALYKSLEAHYSDKALKLLENIERDTSNLKRSSLKEKSVFKVAGDKIQIMKGDRWEDFFLLGVNIGLALPGYFPGEYPIKMSTYLRWFKMIYDLGLNTVRVYTIQNPDFYKALYEFNKDGIKLFLLQGIWYERPEKGDLDNKGFIRRVLQDIKEVVDAVHGNIKLEESYGKPHGVYTLDVSGCLIGYIFGREPEACMVKEYNERKLRKKEDYLGKFLYINSGEPFEVWNAKMCDYVLQYQQEKYGHISLISMVNWPTLDPLVHPSESNHEEELKAMGQKVVDVCSENEDMERFDTAKIKCTAESCFFSSYHIYPYYPDFMINNYINSKTPYLDYLRELKAHHKGQPVVVAEFGVPTSRESAHWQQGGLNQGGNNELQQGEYLVQMLKDIKAAGMAGAIIFSWFDEWFKINWIFQPYYNPKDRKSLWLNIRDPEEMYGLVAMYPGYPDKACTLSGDEREWINSELLYSKEEGQCYHCFGDGGDESRKLVSLRAKRDEGFIYLALKTSGKVDFSEASYIIAINVAGPETGEFLLPFNTKLVMPIGLQFIIQLCGKDKSRILVQHTYDRFTNYDSRIVSVESNQGAFIPMYFLTNRRRFDKEIKKTYPARHHAISPLRMGSLKPDREDYNSLADFNVNGNLIELRIPYCLINFSDPSSKRIIWWDGNVKSLKTEGVRFIAFSYKPSRDNHNYAEETGKQYNITDILPHPLSLNKIKTYSWEEWSVPLYHEYLKKSYFILKSYIRGEI